MKVSTFAEILSHTNLSKFDGQSSYSIEYISQYIDSLFESGAEAPGIEHFAYKVDLAFTLYSGAFTKFEASERVVFDSFGEFD